MMDGLITLLQHMQPWHWLALGLVLLVLEIVTGTSYLLWPAAAAGATGVMLYAAPHTGYGVQLGVFAMLTIVLTLTGRNYMKGRWLAQDDGVKLNERGAQMVGQIGVAEGEFAAGQGRVKLGDTVWRATSGDAILAGERVEVTGADGSSLVVKKAP